MHNTNSTTRFLLTIIGSFIGNVNLAIINNPISAIKEYMYRNMDDIVNYHPSLFPSHNSETSDTDRVAVSTNTKTFFPIYIADNIV